MKKTVVLVLGLFCIGLMVSCKKEGCIYATAINYDTDAEKDDGSCIFPEPEPDVRDAYIGSYLVADSLFQFGSFTEVNTYILQVSKGGTVSDTIYLNNLWNDGKNFIAVIAGDNFSIPSQQVSGPYYASGNGNFSNNIIAYQTSGDVYENRGVGPKQ